MFRVYALGADAAMVVHAAFILFIAVGSLLALRWPRLVWLHVPALAWGVGIVAVGWRCPLTSLEKTLRRRAGAGYEGGFVDRYIEDVIYPDEYTPLLRAMAAVVIVVGYVALLRRHGLRRTASASASSTTSMRAASVPATSIHGAD